MARKSIPVATIEPSGNTSATVGNDDGTTDTKPEVTGNGNEPELIYGFESIDPAGIDTGNGDGNGSGDGGTVVRRRRGRPPGSGRGATKAQKSSGNIGGLERLLYTIHGGLALLVAEEFNLEEGECKMYADAVRELNRQYERTISPKAEAWVNLFTAAGMIYGPRIWAIRNRTKKEKEQTPTPTLLTTNTAPDKVVTMNARPAAPAPQTERKGPQTPADLFGLDYSGFIAANAGE